MNASVSLSQVELWEMNSEIPTGEAAVLSCCLDAMQSFKMLAVSIYSQSYCLVFGTSVSIKNKA